MLKNFFLMLLAVILTGIFIIPVFIINLWIRRKNLKQYFITVAIGFDQLMGSILYSRPDWTVSSWTYFLCQKGDKWACRFMKVIDFLFGKNHCEKSFLWEKTFQIIKDKKRRK